MWESKINLREVIKYARVEDSEVTGGPLDPKRMAQRATLRVVPFMDGGSGCGD